MNYLRLQSLLVVASCVAITSGCTTIHKSQPNAQMHISVDAPLKADIKVGEKIKGTAYSKILLGVFVLEGSNNTKFADGVNYGGDAADSLMMALLGRQADPLLAAATYDAVTSSGADIIIAPRYEIEIDDSLLVVKKKVTVTGYKGTITHFK